MALYDAVKDNIQPRSNVVSMYYHHFPELPPVLHNLNRSQLKMASSSDHAWKHTTLLRETRQYGVK